MSAAEEELLVASTALDVATHFAGGSALALPREGAFFGVDATGLAGILAQMGSSIATLRDEMVRSRGAVEKSALCFFECCVCFAGNE